MDDGCTGKWVDGWMNEWMMDVQLVCGWVDE